MSCNRSYEAENPNIVSAKYCRCLENQLKNEKDSSVDFTDCEKKVFRSSRLMKIYMSFDNYNDFNESTIDSAKEFSLKVRNLIDSQCYNKKTLKNKLKSQ